LPPKFADICFVFLCIHLIKHGVEKARRCVFKSEGIKPDLLSATAAIEALKSASMTVTDLAQCRLRYFILSA
jgi:hypothetical protein